jgi:hypothetical protein
MLAQLVGTFKKAFGVLKFHRVAMEVKPMKIGGRWWFHFASLKVK